MGVKRDGYVHCIKFERGETIQPLTVIGEASDTGTTTRFKAIPKYFKKRLFMNLIF